MPLPSFEGPNSNLAPVFLLRLARIKARTITSTCTFSTSHFDRQVLRVAGHLLHMLGKWPMADSYIESCRGVPSLIFAQTQVLAPSNSRPVDGYRKGGATPMCTWSPAKSGSWDMLHVGLEHVGSLHAILHMH